MIQRTITTETTCKKRGGGYPSWSANDDEKLLAICETAKPTGTNAWRAIANEFPHRTFYSVGQRYLTLRMRAGGVRPKSRAPETARYSKAAPPVPILWPKTLTAFILGDPLPGRSALDVKRAQGASA